MSGFSSFASYQEISSSAGIKGKEWGCLVVPRVRIGLASPFWRTERNTTCTYLLFSEWNWYEMGGWPHSATPVLTCELTYLSLFFFYTIQPSGVNSRASPQFEHRTSATPCLLRSGCPPPKPLPKPLTCCLFVMRMHPN